MLTMLTMLKDVFSFTILRENSFIVKKMFIESEIICIKPYKIFVAIK